MATLDRTGQYRRDLGWKKTASGTRSQQRFYLGRDKDAASLAEKRLEKFWNGLERYWSHNRYEECLWEEWSLAIAKQIADGKMVVTVELPRNFREANADPEEIQGLEAAASWLNVLKDYFGTVCGFEMAEAEAAERLQSEKG